MSATAAGNKAFISVGTTLKQGSEFLREAGRVRQAQLCAFGHLLPARTEHTRTVHPLAQL